MSDILEQPQPTSEPATEKSTVTRRRLLEVGGATLAAGLASPVLNAAASPALEPAKRAMRASKKTQLKLMSWEMFEPGEKAAWVKVINDFMVANPSIQVTWTGWPFSTYDQNVIAQAQAGMVDADVVQCPPELATTLISNYNMCVPLTQIPKALGLIPNNSHNQFTMNGQLYGLGIIQVAFAMRYDKRILKQAGFSGPPTSLDEWLAITKAVTKPPKQFGNDLLNTVAAGADWWNALQNFCLLYDGVWAKGKTLTINSPENVKGLEFWLEIVNASGLKGSSEAVILKLSYSDQIAMMFDVSLGASTLKAEAPKLYPNLATAAPPWPNRKAISRLHPIVVLKSSKNQDAAMELAKWVITPKNLWYVTQQNGYPICPYTNFGKFIPQYNAFEKSLPWYTGFQTTNYVGESDIFGDYTFAYAQFGNIIQGNLEKAISGSSTVKEALDASQAQAQTSLPKP